MRRFFFAFPAGQPGLGLLLLRFVTALSLVDYRALGYMPAAIGDAAFSAALIASRLALLIGLFTRTSATLLAGTAAWLWLGSGGATTFSPALLFLIADAVALALIGPGAFSMDSRLFGPHEILIPPEAPTRS